MASFFSSKVQRLKETIGQAQATEDPEDVKDVKEHLRSLRAHNSTLRSCAKNYSADCSKSASTGDKLGTALMDFSKEYEQSPLGEALIRMGETQNALNALQQAFASQTTEIFVASLRRMNDEHIKSAVDLKNKQEEARVAYDIALNRQRELAGKANDPKYKQRCEEADQAVNVAKAAYDTLNQQLVNRLNEFDLQNSVDTIGNLRTYMRTQLSYFKDAFELLNEMSPHIDELEQRNNAFIAQMQRQAAELLRQQQQQTPSQAAAPAYGAQPYAAQQPGAQPYGTQQPPIYSSGGLPPQQSAYSSGPPAYASQLNSQPPLPRPGSQPGYYAHQ